MPGDDKIQRQDVVVTGLDANIVITEEFTVTLNEKFNAHLEDLLEDIGPAWEDLLIDISEYYNNPVLLYFRVALFFQKTHSTFIAYNINFEENYLRFLIYLNVYTKDKLQDENESSYEINQEKIIFLAKMYSKIVDYQQYYILNPQYPLLNPHHKKLIYHATNLKLDSTIEDSQPLFIAAQNDFLLYIIRILVSDVNNKEIRFKNNINDGTDNKNINTYLEIIRFLFTTYSEETAFNLINDREKIKKLINNYRFYDNNRDCFFQNLYQKISLMIPSEPTDEIKNNKKTRLLYEMINVIEQYYISKGNVANALIGLIDVFTDKKYGDRDKILTFGLRSYIANKLKKRLALVEKNSNELIVKPEPIRDDNQFYSIKYNPFFRIKLAQLANGLSYINNNPLEILLAIDNFLMFSSKIIGENFNAILFKEQLNSYLDEFSLQLSPEKFYKLQQLKSDLSQLSDQSLQSTILSTLLTNTKMTASMSFTAGKNKQAFWKHKNVSQLDISKNYYVLKLGLHPIQKEDVFLKWGVNLISDLCQYFVNHGIEETIGHDRHDLILEEIIPQIQELMTNSQMKTIDKFIEAAFILKKNDLKTGDLHIIIQSNLRMIPESNFITHTRIKEIKQSVFYQYAQARQVPSLEKNSWEMKVQKTPLEEIRKLRKEVNQCPSEMNKFVNWLKLFFLGNALTDLLESLPGEFKKIPIDSSPKLPPPLPDTIARFGLGKGGK